VNVNFRPSTSVVPPLFPGDVLRALLAEPASELDLRDDGRAVLLRDRNRVADVVAVAVRNGDDVGALGRCLPARTLRVPVQERVDVDPFSARRVDAKGGVPEPGECGFGHRSPLSPGVPRA